MRLAPRMIRRRGFSLIEAVVVILTLAIAMPTTLIWLDEANQRRADSVNQTRATALGSLVMEHILADVSSKNASLGFAPLANSATYLNTPATGLVARLSSITTLYTAMNVTYAVTIGSLVDKGGATTGIVANDIYRVVTVTVSYPSAAGPAQTIAFRSLVGAL